MLDPQTQDETAGLPIVGAPCRHLRNKSMYVFTDVEPGMSSEGHQDSICWCLQTMTGFGPDDEFVDAHECRNPSRSCFEPV